MEKLDVSAQEKEVLIAYMEGQMQGVLKVYSMLTEINAEDHDGSQVVDFVKTIGRAMVKQTEKQTKIFFPTDEKEYNKKFASFLKKMQAIQKTNESA